MSFRPVTNAQSLQAQRFLGIMNAKTNKTLTNLSSGSRINSAKDDAAGLAISETMRGKIRSTAQAVRNVRDGNSMLQVADGSLTEVSNILIRMRELAMQSATDTVDDEGKQMIENEFSNLIAEIDRISKTTEFAGKKLLNGESPVLRIQIGNGVDPFKDTMSIDFEKIKSRSADLGIDIATTITSDQARQSLGIIDKAMMRVNGARAEIGAKMNRLQSTENNLNIQKENLAESNSIIRDTDMSQETANLTRNNILRASSSSVLAQANRAPNQVTKLLTT